MGPSRTDTEPVGGCRQDGGVSPAPLPVEVPVQAPVHVSGRDELVAVLRGAGTGRGDAVALAVDLGTDGSVPVGLATSNGCWSLCAPRQDAVRALRAVEEELRPRWVWWSAATTAGRLVGAGLRVATCWDLAAVHRLLLGGAADDPARVWACLLGLDLSTIPRTGQLDLLRVAASTVAASTDAGPSDAAPNHAAPTEPPGGGVGSARPAPAPDPDGPLEPDGHLRADWADGGWRRSPDRAARWARTALVARDLQERRLTDGPDPHRRRFTAHAESAAALLCVELAATGLPIDVAGAERLVTEVAGPRPRDAAHEAELRRARDDVVLRHLPDGGSGVDLRNPVSVRTALSRAGFDLPDTRSWRLEPWRGSSALVDALLAWRKAERVATTYGYGWLDRHVGPDGRLRGAWSASDGAGGRMTAQAGLHNLPAELRPAVAAEPGRVLVRADLGQVEPRVLAAVSGDAALAAATREDDLYAPVAARLGVERAVAKVAVLAAMYGQTSGTAGQALAGLERAYPVAMGYLKRAYDDGWAGRAVTTYGGRRVPVGALPAGLDEAGERWARARRGRFARNAVVQGAAAELFKAWAVTVRATARPRGAEVVLCLHDELLVDAPQETADDVAELLHAALEQVGQSWTGGRAVRFVADVRVVRRWSEAKD
jgi:DNA polymerase-1